MVVIMIITKSNVALDILDEQMPRSIECLLYIHLQLIEKCAVVCRNCPRHRSCSEKAMV